MLCPQTRAVAVVARKRATFSDRKKKRSVGFVLEQVHTIYKTVFMCVRMIKVTAHTIVFD